MTKIVSGDDIRIPITLKKNGSTFIIPPSSIVKASLVSRSKQVLIGPISCLIDDAGSNWEASLINVYFPSNLSISLAEQSGAMVEVQIDDGGKLTWFSDGITIEVGTIE